MTFQQRVLHELSRQERSTRWLARKIEVEPGYLYQYLRGAITNPGVNNQKYANLRARICVALDWPIE